MAAHVSERTRPGTPLVPPAHRRLRAAAVVGPVPAAEMQHLSKGTGADQLADVSDARGAAESEAHPRDRGRCLRPVSHRAGVLKSVTERFLAQDVLAGGQ